MGSAEPPRGDAFGSCVRLLTQLLVHVDPGGAAPEEAGAAGEHGAAFLRGQARGSVRG